MKLKENEMEECLNPAQSASHKALSEVYEILEQRKSFLVEAGAGAGKTYTLVKVLKFLVERNGPILQQKNQKIACITYTNVAKDEIDNRTDRNPMIYCNTINAFCWSLISQFQKSIREQLVELKHWPELIAEANGISDQQVEYELGYRHIDDDRISIHHDDVLRLTVKLMNSMKFRNILTGKYPVILIDEYQDTNAEWIQAIKTHLLGRENSPQFGFFGDHWQKIYTYGCGKIEDPNLAVVGVEANFRSVSPIVDCLNRMRPELPQFVVDPTEKGNVHVFQTNNWTGERRTGNHWGGDLPIEVAEDALESVRAILENKGWDMSASTTKMLMLTHQKIATNQGYPSLPDIFKYNRTFTNKEHPHISYFADDLEPACEAYLCKKYGEMFQALGPNAPMIRSLDDKRNWLEAMERLIELRENGTVGEVIDHLLKTRKPAVPGSVERIESQLRNFDSKSGDKMPRSLEELRDLRAIPYKEITELCCYLLGHSPFETKHGVKGAEYDNVLVVVDRGWNMYNFNEMFELVAEDATIPSNKQKAFDRNRNLFYVCCSRPKKELAILFTQRLSDPAMQTIVNWFGSENIEAVNFK